MTVSKDLTIYFDVLQKKKQQIVEEVSEQEQDDDLAMDNANLGNDDILPLTAEEKEEQIIKNLNSNNPQAPHNMVQFSFKERLFKQDQNVEHMIFHVNMDGNLLQHESDDHRDQ